MHHTGVHYWNFDFSVYYGNNIIAHQILLVPLNPWFLSPPVHIPPVQYAQVGSYVSLSVTVTFCVCMSGLYQND